MKKKNVIIIICIVLFVIFIGIGSTLFLLTKNKTSNETINEVKKPTIKEKVEVEINSSVLKISDFFSSNVDFKNVTIFYYLNDEEITFTNFYDKLGEFKVLIKAEDNEYQTLLKVIDTTAPELEVQDVTIVKNSGYDISKFVVSCKDNSEEDCILKYSDNAMANYQEVGEYTVSIVAKDASENVVQKDAKLTITKEISNQNPPTSNNGSSNQSSSNNQNISSNSNSTSNNNSNNPNNNTYINYYTKDRTEKEDFKYGVKLVKEITDYYRVKQDNSVETYDSKVTRTYYDFSGYNGTASTLTSEARTNSVTYSAMANEIVSLVNNLRTSLGKTKLSLDSNLTTMAMIRAMELSYGNTFSHTRPNGNICFSLGSEFNYPFYAENIAAGQTSASNVFNSWKNSSGHYQNMINSDYKKIGIGVNYFDGKYYWVQIFSY